MRPKRTTKGRKKATVPGPKTKRRLKAKRPPLRKRLSGVRRTASRRGIKKAARNPAKRRSPGIQKVASRGTAPLPQAFSKSVGVIVSAMNEEATIGGVLTEVCRLPIQELVVVINGSTDGTLGKAKAIAGEKGMIIHYPERLGYDVGRAVGAKLAQSDILLFLDGDFILAAERLVPFIQAIERGADVALNDMKPFSGLFRGRDDVSMLKEFLNRALGRPELGVNSLTAVPHALSRKALETIGASKLAVPPSAQAAAVQNGLRVVAPASVNVYETNRLRRQNTGAGNPVAQLIIGDHLEALHSLMASEGSRLRFGDGIRHRRYAGEEAT